MNNQLNNNRLRHLLVAAESVGQPHLLSDPTIKDEVLAVLRNLVERVVVSPLPDGFQVELVDAIANMLSLPDQGPELDGYKSSVKVVAGARNHRDRHLIEVPV